jgi:hypothetical protein
MKALATWSPAPYLNVTTAEREDSRWLVTIFGGEHACCHVAAWTETAIPNFINDIDAADKLRNCRLEARISLAYCR